VFLAAGPAQGAVALADAPGAPADGAVSPDADGPVFSPDRVGARGALAPRARELSHRKDFTTF